MQMEMRLCVLLVVMFACAIMGAEQSMEVPEHTGMDWSVLGAGSARRLLTVARSSLTWMSDNPARSTPVHFHATHVRLIPNSCLQ
jgi:hypothetical protein